jgi:hypothetical protein
MCLNSITSYLENVTCAHCLMMSLFDVYITYLHTLLSVSKQTEYLYTLFEARNGMQLYVQSLAYFCRLRQIKAIENEKIVQNYE